ncbi:hypothetical protein BC828DRAFT_379002 [Blastocladiella britannica]|nr:hypothetical protein BC828DRAFT_379002 [Blastocladiella britannica]
MDAAGTAVDDRGTRGIPLAFGWCSVSIGVAAAIISVGRGAADYVGGGSIESDLSVVARVGRVGRAVKGACGNSLLPAINGRRLQRRIMTPNTTVITVDMEWPPDPVLSVLDTHGVDDGVDVFVTFGKFDVLVGAWRCPIGLGSLAERNRHANTGSHGSTSFTECTLPMGVSERHEPEAVLQYVCGDPWRHMW